MGGLLGYTAGFAAASAVPVLGQSGIFNFAGGMMGGMLGDMLANKIAKFLATTPLGQIPDPLWSDGRMLVRDPDVPFQPQKSKEEDKNVDEKTSAETPATSPKTEKMSKEFKIGKKTLDLSKPMGGLSQKEYTDLSDKHRRILDRRLQAYANKNAKARHAAIKANQTGSSAEGLDTKPSYGSGGFVTIENTTTYIQPVEV